MASGGEIGRRMLSPIESLFQFFRFDTSWSGFYILLRFFGFSSPIVRPQAKAPTSRTSGRFHAPWKGRLRTRTTGPGPLSIGAYGSYIR